MTLRHGFTTGTAAAAAAKAATLHLLTGRAPDSVEVLLPMGGRMTISIMESRDDGDGILAVGATGMVWDEALLAEYVVDPTAFVDTHGGSGKSKMTFKLAKGGEDIAAYLASVVK